MRLRTNSHFTCYCTRTREGNLVFQPKGKTYVEGVRAWGAVRICGPKREKETEMERERRKLRNEVFHNPYSAPNTSRLMESTMM
jgi:hypothetical protein